MATAVSLDGLSYSWAPILFVSCGLFPPSCGQAVQMSSEQWLSCVVTATWSLRELIGPYVLVQELERDNAESAAYVMNAWQLS